MFSSAALRRIALATPIMIPVESSNVSGFGYDEDENSLFVEFLRRNSGPVTYKYYNVELDVYMEFLAAPSKGQFVWQYLRDRYYYETV